ncbi:hypothetical protein H6796_01270 [Candidatus Nomurabacteria bacterium]|nr:hypothetical protein [Candidatus Nomurabacteria bacterium]
MQHTPDPEAHGRRHRSIEIGVGSEIEEEVDTRFELYSDDEFDSETVKIVLGSAALGLALSTTYRVWRKKFKRGE